MKLANKIVVVTGGGAGMGRELVLQLLQRGAKVAAVDINPAALEETAKLAGGSAIGAGALATFVVNITDRAAVEALPQKVIDRFGAVDGIINCAGIIQPFVRLKDLDYAAVDRVMGVNFSGTLYMTKSFLPHLVTRPTAHIANVSSMGGFLPVPGQTIYGASKAAVKLMTEGLHSELADTPVRVTIIFPGAVATNITKNSGVDIKMPEGSSSRSFKTLPASDAARMMLDGIERDEFRVLVGQDAKLMDTIYRLNPKRAAAFIYKQMKALLGPAS